MRGSWRIAFSISPGRSERLPTAWIAGQMAQLDRVDGDIDTLMARIAHIRTWTYITHRADWVDDAADWQERARGIEDRLSDALHDSITQRFVDRRSAFLVRHLAGDGELLASVDKDGEVRVEGTYVGRLDGFRFRPRRDRRRRERTLVTAANRVLRGEIDGAGAPARRPMPTRRSRSTRAGELLWRGGAGRPAGGRRAHAGAAGRGAGRRLSRGRARERVRQRLQAFCRTEIERRLAPLFAAQALPLGGVGARPRLPAGRRARLPAGRRRSPGRSALDRPTAARWAGWASGSAPRASISSRCCGAEAVRFRALLWAVRHGRAPPPLPGRAASPRRSRSIRRCRRRSTPRSGGASLGGLALRADRLERLAAAARRSRATAAFAAMPSWRRSPVSSPPRLRGVLIALGYRAVIEGGDEFFVARGAAPAPRRQRGAAKPRRGASLCQAAGAETRLSGGRSATAASRRLDQWLWFARLPRAARSRRGSAPRARSRSTVCCGQTQSAGAGRRLDRRAARELSPNRADLGASGSRRGPASEARTLYELLAAPVRLSEIEPAWEPLLAEDELEQ